MEPQNTINPGQVPRNPPVNPQQPQVQPTPNLNPVTQQSNPPNSAPINGNSQTPSPGATVSSFVPEQPSQVFSSQPKKSKLPLIVGAVILVLLIVASGIYALGSHKKPSKNATSSATKIVDCGKITVTDATFNTSPYKGCFDQHFINCTQAQITVDIEASFGKGTINQYQIQSKQSSSCLVQWQYVALPSNATWQGKTVTCAYDSSKEFLAALSAKTDFTGCTGPLLSVMKTSASTPSIQGGTTTQTSGGSSVTTSPGVTVIQNK